MLRVILLISFAVCLHAAADRIVGPVDAAKTVRLAGHVAAEVKGQYDRGPADPGAEISRVTMLLKPAPEVEGFLLDLQTPSSRDFHRWLTPEQFGERFGASQNDVAKIVGWLTSQGLRVDQVAHGRHWVSFTGSAARMGRALHTEFRRYEVDGRIHVANSSDPSIPAAMAGVVSGFHGLHDFGVRPLVRVRPQNNSGGSHALAPDDFATIYNVTPLYQAGFDGTGQKIVIVGDSGIDLTDIRAFRKRFNLPAADPQTVLVGADPAINPDVIEADLDIEWAGAVARGATIIYVYARNFLDAVQYAVDQNLGPVLSMSFGGCELINPTGFRAVAQQAAAQGITMIAASGDWGSATCDVFDSVAQAGFGATVSFPGSLPEVTAVGGTQFADLGGNFWAATNDGNGASALSYIPEQAWNEAAKDNDLTASGGGPSALYSKPLWQAGPGVPGGNARMVPDVALAASDWQYPYLFNTAGLAISAGGTSGGAPTFAGITTLLNQYLVSKGGQAGLGNINPALYQLARSTTGIFHDITDGDNKVPCRQSSPDCVGGLVGFSAGPGYDPATGLGSVDAYKFVTGWSNGVSSTTTLSASPASFALLSTVQLTATVTGTAGGAVPTGTVAFVVTDGANDNTLGTATLTPSGKVATATLAVSGSLMAAADNIVNAIYSGDSVYTGSAGTATVSLQMPASGSYAVPYVTPNPGYQQVPGGNWPMTVKLVEKNGVATKLTGFTINGNPQDLSLWATTDIPANGTILRKFGLLGLTPPTTRVFGFSGADANGQTWTRSITVSFLGPASPPHAPAMSLTSPQTTVVRDPTADPNCQWRQQLTVQETGGYYVDLTQLTAGPNDFTGQIQQIFGTTRLAPYGMLQGSLCWTGLTGVTSRTYSLTGTTEGDVIETLTAGLNTVFGAAASSPASLSVDQQAVTIGDSGTASLGISFGGAATQWNVWVSPANRNSQWLTVSPLSGTGAAQLTLTASASGLSNGVYNAVVTIQSPGSLPQVEAVPVTFVVGGSPTMSVGRLENGFSNSTTFAPGMILAIHGTNLAPSTVVNAVRPLPLSINGVSVTINGVTAPLYYISADQLNVQIPYETSAGTAVLGVNNNGQIAATSFPVAVTAPGLYPSAIDLSAQLASTAKQGQTLLLFVTGEGDVTPTLVTGATPTTSNAAKLPKPRLDVTVTVGGVPATVSFAGIPKGLVGASQINFTVPANAPLGNQQVVVIVGGVAAPPVMLSVTPSS